MKKQTRDQLPKEYKISANIANLLLQNVGKTMYKGINLFATSSCEEGSHHLLSCQVAD